VRFLEVTLIALSVVPLLAAPAMAGTPDSQAGAMLAGHTLQSLDGGKMKLSSLRGEVVVVNFWASWCTPCLKELPLMNEWHEAWANRGARVVAISIDSEAHKARKFVKKTNLSMMLYHDGPDGLARQLDLPSVPCTFLLDREGRVVRVVTSSSKDALSTLHKEVEAMLGAKKRAVVQKANVGATASDGTTDDSTPGGER
jgi:peroxiredoxin